MIGSLENQSVIMESLTCRPHATLIGVEAGCLPRKSSSVPRHSLPGPLARIPVLPGKSWCTGAKLHKWPTYGCQRSAHRPMVRALARAEKLKPVNGKILYPESLTMQVGGRNIVIETGRMGRQASGAITLTDGETVLYSTACFNEEPCEPSDFVPLTVNYQERFSAAGRTSGGFLKREGRPRDHEVLICRLIDRPIRPMMTKGFHHEVQLLLWVLSYDGVASPAPLAITAAGAALAISDIPMKKPVAGVRVGMNEAGEFIVNPTVDQMETSKLDLILAGTADAVLMIEGYCSFLTEDQMLEAISTGHAAVAEQCKAISQWAAEVGKSKRTDRVRPTPEGLRETLAGLLGKDMEAALRIGEKQLRGKAIKELGERALQVLTAEGQASKEDSDTEEEFWEDDEVPEIRADRGGKDEEPVLPEDLIKRRRKLVYNPADIKAAFKALSSNLMRKILVQEGTRSDGRGPKDVRPIESSCNVLPRPHGSALFTRGETQALATVTLGSDEMGQRVDSMATSTTERFYLQYNFPPSCVGETGRTGAPGRREIGHGELAERAIQPALPQHEAFPYSIRVESMITESNGSSSMASVCGGCLALLDAGVPLHSMVAGVAMGLILNTAECGGDGSPMVLTDILGSEDALGDMDFKVAGNEEGVTAFQMDIKVEGITVEVMKAALDQAREGRQHILKQMAKCSPPPRSLLSRYAPRIETMQIASDQVSMVIGSRGAVVKGIIEESGVNSININDDGKVCIFGNDDAAIGIAREKILGLTLIPEVGAIYKNCLVKAVVAFGCFVEIAPGKEGLCHVSELALQRVDKVEDVVKQGDRLDVQVIELNERGQIRLSHKAVLLKRQKEGGNNGAETAQAVGGKLGPRPTVDRQVSPNRSGQRGASPERRPAGVKVDVWQRPTK